ncbi:hypothetical protein F5Y00DRAFT_260969 [Daldinia vernicosa]|uniref:uncharacterized protein n=1 Tax=Daldinia vernicosa TaxID=114800 RepID=UPI00200854C3|nr:uncharacterized protein F5Y00DRAFT_260969 [Daldinia vernicosa]KAI0849864.1 hypothetical protein F5Y00DRAFT_260969 [Daldinia vernicosa]
MKELSHSGTTNLRAAVSMLALSVVSVTVRLALRRWARIPLSWSDWLILVGLAMIGVNTGLIVQYIVAGPGPGTYDMNDIALNYTNGGADWAAAMMKELYVGDLFFGLAITSVKLSILAFYRDIFAISKPFQRWNSAACVLCIVWFIVFAFCNIFQCNPPSALWEHFGSTEYCIASGPLWLGYELTNFFLDVLVLVLPIVMVHRLRLRTAQKWSVASIFLLGSLVCVASIVRMVYIWHPQAPETVSISQVQALSSIQLGIAVLCACLPTYGPLLNLSRKGLIQIKRAIGFSVSDTSSHSGIINGRNAKDLTDRSEYYRMCEGESDAHVVSASADGIVEAHALGDIPSRSIMVSRSVRVT